MGLKEFETLIKLKELEVSDGVYVICKEELKLSIFEDKGAVVIKFDAPFPYLLVKKLGPKQLMNLVEPKIESVLIKDKSITISLSNFPDFEIKREDDE